MSEDYGPVDQAFLGAMGSLQGLVGVAQAEMMGLERHEYELVPVEKLNEYAADRWRVVAIPAVQEISIVLGTPKPGPLTFLMERRMLADESALRQLAGGEL